jgi:hypothetical protein
MSRYVYEVQPYHTVRELEMDRIMKAKYLKKFFSKRDKKDDVVPAAKRSATTTTRREDVSPPPPPRPRRPDELSVPENEPFRKAFAVNGFHHGEDDVTGPAQKVRLGPMLWLQFSAIFGEKIGVFSQTNGMIKKFL